MIKKTYQYVISHVRKRLTRPRFLMLMSVFTGLVAGLAGVMLKMLIHEVQSLSEAHSLHLYFIPLLPAVGLIITSLIVHGFFYGYMERGITMVLKAIASKSSFIPLKDTYFHAITSSVTVGMGGSAGLEGPIVATGASVGSNLGRITELSYQERSLLIACGAASGIAAVFNAPVAGMIFSMEILMAETVVSYLVPLIMASVSGVLVSKMILSEKNLFNFNTVTEFEYSNVPYYIGLGLICGFISIYYSIAFKSTEHTLQKIKTHFLFKALMGGILLGVIYVFFPSLYGEGYRSIKLLGNGIFPENQGYQSVFSNLNFQIQLIVVSLCIILLKPIAAGITLGAGGNGGNFAPSLFTGAFTGFTFASFLHLFPIPRVPVGNFSLVAMAGVLSGVMYSPLTAIFLIAEITNGYELFIPLMIVSSLSYVIVKSYQPYSMEMRNLAQSGQIPSQKKVSNLLHQMDIVDVLKDNPMVLKTDLNFAGLIKIIKSSDDNTLVVVKPDGTFVGIIEVNDIKEQLFDFQKYIHTSIQSYVKRPRALLKSQDDCEFWLKQFELTHTWLLPVIDHERKFIGLVSRAKILSKIRESLTKDQDFLASE